MWAYAFNFHNNRAVRNDKSPGYLAMATMQPIKPNARTSVTIRARTANGFVRLGLVNKKVIA